jgi:hypothetical protein
MTWKVQWVSAKNELVEVNHCNRLRHAITTTSARATEGAQKSVVSQSIFNQIRQFFLLNTHRHQAQCSRHTWFVRYGGLLLQWRVIWAWRQEAALVAWLTRAFKINVYVGSFSLNVYASLLHKNCVCRIVLMNSTMSDENSDGNHERRRDVSISFSKKWVAFVRANLAREFGITDLSVKIVCKSGVRRGHVQTYKWIYGMSNVVLESKIVLRISLTMNNQ